MKIIFFLIAVLFSIQANAFSFQFRIYNSWPDVSNGLIVNLSLDSTTIVESISGLTLTGTVTSNQTFPAKRNNGLKLKTLSGSVVSNNEMTACAWMNIPSAFIPVSYAPYYGFVRKSGKSAYNQTVWYRLSPLGYFSGTSQVADDAATRTNPDISTLNDNNFHHYCTTLDNVNKIAKTYRDGVIVYIANGILKWNNYGTSINFLNEIVDTSGDAQAPLVDEWKLYNRILSFTEIQRLAQIGSIYDGGLISNGYFSNGITGWIGSNGALTQSTAHPGTATVTTNTTGSNYFRQLITTTAGSTYQVIFSLKAISGSAGIALDAHAMDSGQDPRNGIILGASGLKTATGTYTYTFIAGSSQSQIIFAPEVNNGTAIIDNVKVIKL